MPETKESTVVAVIEQPSTKLMRLGDTELTPEQVALITRTVAKGATPDELALFIMVCNRTGLDPFTRQIHAVKRKSQNDEGQWVDVMTHQIGIDGQRLISDRSGKYDGMTTPLFYDPAGNAREVWLDTKPPRACKVGIRRRGISEPIYAVALFEEFVQKKRNGETVRMWKEKPTVMLAKCAEAMARRMAFPQELSGLYVHEEMPLEIEDEATDPQPVTRTVAHVEGPGSSASVGTDGDITLTFGKLKNRKLSTLTRDELERTFIEPWKDAQRERLAADRLGAGFVKAVKARYESLPPKTADELAAEKLAVTRATFDGLVAKKQRGEKLDDESADELRCLLMDHPEWEASATEGDGLTKAAAAVGVAGL